MPYRVLALSVLLSLPALATPKPTLHYDPLPDMDERPLPVDIWVAPQGSDFALRVEYNRAPWGLDCKERCANTTFFIDTDDNRSTGLDMGPKAKETGADLAVVIQGAREYRERSADTFLRVKVIQLSGVSNVDQGDVIAELDNRNDKNRVIGEGTLVIARVDATSGTLPSARKARVVYHPPGEHPLEAIIAGMLSGHQREIEIFKRGQLATPHKKHKREE